MQTYLVGGAVRDRLLGRPVRERDFVVVGADPEEMIAQGFRQVGKDFPVFLHPETREEHALARTERRGSAGNPQRVVHTDPEVTLEQDLARRDLTINALAEDCEGRVIDPYGGLRDLQQRLLRHVSPAFSEDPVRVLRLARFAARYADLGFTVAAETRELIEAMARRGDLDTLVPERVWQELLRALQCEQPSVFFECLRACAALRPIFPELDRLWGVPQPERWHPEVDTGVHVMMVVDQAARLCADPEVRFAALVHDLGKGETPPDRWPGHHGHEQRSAQLVDELCQRLRAPTRFRELACQVALHHGLAHRAAELRPGTVLKLLEASGAFRRAERLDQFLLACEADYRGRAGLEQRPYPQAEILRAAYRAAADVDRAGLAEAGKGGDMAAIGRELRRRRLDAISASRRARPSGAGQR